MQHVDKLVEPHGIYVQSVDPPTLASTEECIHIIFGPYVRYNLFDIRSWLKITMRSSQQKLFIL